ncbi:E3 ubiquitin-protein ligase MSL2 [Anastrepha obliqua]|uniref:E3 ubiquitin-protein ligase MSL2 n=1 Tax=Anastrepha obliqua TaxID=95512 RepID=UPI0024096883|nr:E3 ubiquitin-protein ligase MSL2 [Anastrepha obliqua]XP_054741918.1 E3 ubiquitin-protein ligase MSL2 [Anastrepha obliqua]
MFSVVSGSASGGCGVGEDKRLDAMNAVCVYVSTAQLVLQSDTTESNGLGEQRMFDLTRLFGQLRQLLSCAVCARLLNDPYAPLNNARCHHNVCRLCVRGRKALRPLCISCKDLQDFKTYGENKTMRCLLLCYKSLCEHMLGTNFYAQLSRQKAHQALTCSGENVFGVASMPHMTTCGDIIQEGARYEDILNAFNADLPQIGPVVKLHHPLATIPTVAAAATSQSTPLSVSAVTPLAPLTMPQKRLHTQTAPRLATPPNPPAAISNSSSTLIPTHGTIIKLEQQNTNLTSTHSHAHLVMTSKVNSSVSIQTQPHNQSHMVYVNNLKSGVGEPANVHTSQLCTTQSIVGSNNNSIAPLSAAPTITYVGPNTPGIVVPIVSSSATTTAPLTIASAKLQSLKRQLAQAQARGGAPISIASAVKAAGLTHSDTHAPITFKVSTTTKPTSSATISAVTTSTIANSISITSATPTTTTATITTQQIRNPPSIKTVSNGSAMYSVLYTGVGNKITIKRKTDGDDESGQRKSVASSISTSSNPSTTPAATSNPPGIAQQQTPANKLNAKRRGCRCGNATPTPGKLTCCGQRCPCYVDSKSCIGCKCRGCRNPHRPDGGKVRPVIPELACYEIQMADETPSLSPTDLQVGNTLSMRTHTISAATATSPLQLSAHQQSATAVSEQHNSSSTAMSSSSVATVPSQLHLTTCTSSPSSKGATLIPFISLHPISSQQSQHQQQQQQTQTITNISSNQQQTNMLPMESVLIQNAEGKYQVVNVLTTGPTHHQQNNSSIQRIHNIPQLQVVSSASSNSSNNNSHTILGNMTTVNILSSTTTNTVASSPTTVTTKISPQSVLLHQQQHTNRLQQQQHQLQQKHHQQQMHAQRLTSSNIVTTSTNNTTTSAVSNSSATTSIPIQLQHHHNHHQHQQQQHQLHHTHAQNQQIKSNIITMRPAGVSNSNAHQSQTLTPILTSNASATTITLSPIIMSSSPNTFKAELFSDSSESDFINFTTGAVTSTTVVNSGGNNSNINSNMLSTIYSHSGLSSTPTTPRLTSVTSLSSGSNGSSASGSASRMSLGMNMNISGTGSHITPALVEVIEASDL